jgi:methionine transaminase
MKSKLPNVSTSIFSTMSLLASQYDAINLSQGFPGFDCPAYLAQNAARAINQGLNQYAPSTGVAILQQQIKNLLATKYNREASLDEITVTSGATEALFVAISTIIEPDDEVIVFDPAYDSYEPVVNLLGGKCVHIELNAPDYSIDWSKVVMSLSAKTKAIIINTPHNPTGSLLSQSDIDNLRDIVLANNLYVISDEVYEHITFDNRPHLSICLDEALYKRSFIISSFGKSFHITGWKVGYCVAPEELSVEFRKIHQYVTFSTSTPMQYAIAEMLETNPQHIEHLSQFYQEKRDVFANALNQSRFGVLPCEGTYFQLLDYSAISDLNDVEFAQWLTKNHQVATIPLSPFYEDKTILDRSRVVRVCFAKPEALLIEAANKLVTL